MKRFKELTHLKRNGTRYLGLVLLIAGLAGSLAQLSGPDSSQLTAASTSADACDNTNSYFNRYLESIDFTQCPSSYRSDDAVASGNGVNRRVQNDRKWSCTPNQNDAPISKECIQTSMMRRGPLANANYYACKSSEDNQPRVVAPPCVTPSFVQYMYNETNKVLNCVNSGIGTNNASETLTPHEVFGMLNRESLFMPNVSYIGGIGVAQLVKHGAAQDFFMGPTGHVWNEIKSNPECAPFSKDQPHLMSDPNLVANAKAGHVNTCALLSIDDNPSRSLIMGLTAYRSFKRQILNRLLNKDGNKMTKEEFGSLNEKLTQDAYNAGLGRVYKAYGSIQDSPRIKHRVTAFSKTFQLGSFKQEMARQYLKATNQTLLSPEAGRIIDWIFTNLAMNYDQTDAWQTRNLLLDRESVAKIMRQMRVSNANPSKAALLEAGKVIYNIVKTAPASFFTYSDAIDRDLIKISRGKTQCDLAGSP